MNLSELGVDYIGNVTPEALGHLAELDDSQKNRSFAENVSALPDDVQLDLAKEYAGDGEITEDELEQKEENLDKDSIMLLNQIVTVDIESRVIKKMGTVSKDKMKEIDRSIKTSLGL